MIISLFRPMKSRFSIKRRHNSMLTCHNLICLIFLILILIMHLLSFFYFILLCLIRIKKSFFECVYPFSERVHHLNTHSCRSWVSTGKEHRARNSSFIKIEKETLHTNKYPCIIL